MLTIGEQKSAIENFYNPLYGFVQVRCWIWWIVKVKSHWLLIKNQTKIVSLWNSRYEQEVKGLKADLYHIWSQVK